MFDDIELKNQPSRSWFDQCRKSRLLLKDSFQDVDENKLSVPRSQALSPDKLCRIIGHQCPFLVKIITLSFGITTFSRQKMLEVNIRISSSQQDNTENHSCVIQLYAVFMSTF